MSARWLVLALAACSSVSTLEAVEVIAPAWCARLDECLSPWPDCEAATIEWWCRRVDCGGDIPAHALDAARDCAAKILAASCVALFEERSVWCGI